MTAANASARRLPSTTERPSRSAFVQRVGSGLYVDGRPWSFVGMNIYNANSRMTCWYPMEASDLQRAFDQSGATAIRSWFFQSELLPASSGGHWDWSPFDETLATARSAGVRVVVTLTDHWGACEAGGRKDLEWYRSGYRTDRPADWGDGTRPMPATYRDYVQAIVTRYRDDPTVLGWQLVNEPEGTASDGSCPSDAGAVLQDFVADMAGVVRAIDPTHLVSIGTIGSGQCGVGAGDYERLVTAGDLDWCEVHDYYGNNPIGGDQWNGLAARVDECASLGRPFVIGEAGIDRGDIAAPVDRSTTLRAKLAAARGLGVDGYLVWAWADAPDGFGPGDDYAVPAGDPALGVLRAGASSWASAG